MRSILGQAHLGLGLLHKAKGRTEKARENISTAIADLGGNRGGRILKQAREALKALG